MLLALSYLLSLPCINLYLREIHFCFQYEPHVITNLLHHLRFKCEPLSLNLQNNIKLDKRFYL